MINKAKFRFLTLALIAGAVFYFGLAAAQSLPKLRIDNPAGTRGTSIEGLVNFWYSDPNTEITRVRLFLQNLDDGSSYVLGNMTKQSDGEWLIEDWDSTKAPDGAYRIVVDARTPTENLPQELYEYEIKNIIQTLEPAPEPKPEPEPEPTPIPAPRLRPFRHQSPQPLPEGWQQPKQFGIPNPTAFSVDKVEIVEIPSPDKKKKPTSYTLFKGRAPKNTEVWLFIYSENPIVVKVRTDENGQWSYLLEGTVSDGQHVAYVALVDQSGRIQERSQPLPFVKQARSISIVEAEAVAKKSPILEEREEISDVKNFGVFTAGLILFAVLAGVSVIVLIVSHRPKK